jgi:hypothetical protein
VETQKTPIHFLGFLVNVDDSIKGLKMGGGFAVELKSKHDVLPFLRKIEKCSGLRSGFDALSRSHCCVVKIDVAQFDATPQGGVAIRLDVLDEVHKKVQDKCHLLRLFKEGNIILARSFLYHIGDVGGEVRPFGFISEYPVLDVAQFTLAPNEFSEAESFLQTTWLPLSERSIQLAFESFDLSHEVHDVGLAFLSLMTAMEVLLGPKDHQEITYRISRNAAVLLGGNREDAGKVFKDLKDLYRKRSKLVHSGDRSVVARDDVLRLRQRVRETIKEAMRSGMSRDTLLNTLNASGFGERPWRTKQ